MLLNVNAAEWGDSYRILRASEYVRNFSYPSDEKRPPLFSALLALRPLSTMDPILWGRVTMLLVSTTCFLLFYLITRELFSEDFPINICLLLYSLNPIILYWSLRIYADLFFTMWVLLGFYLLLKRKKGVPWIFSLALVAVLSILTRFEGYILAFVIGLQFFLSEKRYISFTQKRFKQAFLYSSLVLMLLLPYWLWRNPLNSSYFSETSTMPYNLRSVAIYVVSLFFLFGFTSAGVFLITKARFLWNFALQHLSISIFMILELVLIFLWPAAIPRLFVPTIPFFIIFLVKSISESFESPSKHLFQGAFFFLFVYLLSQPLLKQQFLIPYAPSFLLLVCMNFLGTLSIYRKNWVGFFVFILLSMVIWSFSILWLHKDIYSTMKSAALYVSSNISGFVGYNDKSALTSWYLDYYSGYDNARVWGSFFPYFGDPLLLQKSYLKEKNFKYLVISNEHFHNLRIDLGLYPYLEEVASFEKTANGQLFFSKIVKVKN